MVTCLVGGTCAWARPRESTMTNTTPPRIGISFRLHSERARDFIRSSFVFAVRSGGEVRRFDFAAGELQKNQIAMPRWHPLWAQIGSLEGAFGSGTGTRRSHTGRRRIPLTSQVDRVGHASNFG